MNEKNHRNNERLRLDQNVAMKLNEKVLSNFYTATNMII